MPTDERRHPRRRCRPRGDVDTDAVATALALREVVERLESVAWNRVPSMTASEAAAITARLDEAAQELDAVLEADHD